jgi:hypothetical protein
MKVFIVSIIRTSPPDIVIIIIINNGNGQAKKSVVPVVPVHHVPFLGGLDILVLVQLYFNHVWRNGPSFSCNFKSNL